MKRLNVLVRYSVKGFRGLLHVTPSTVGVLLLLVLLTACGDSPMLSSTPSIGVGRPPTPTPRYTDAATATPPSTPTTTAQGCAKVSMPENQVRVMHVTTEGYACEHQRPCARPAMAGQSTVYVDGEARTGGGGAMVLQSKGAVFEMRNNATIHFKEISNSIEHVSVEIGRLFASHDACGRVKLVVSAGSMQIETLGTDFEVSVEGGTVDVMVVTGTLQISLYNTEGTEILDNATLSSETGKARLPSIPLAPDKTYRLPEPIQLPELDRKQYWEQKKEWRNIDRINPNVFVDDTLIP